jgi:hypothetical protein
MRKELEAESCSLLKKQQKLEKDVLDLEEQVLAQELKKEKALVEDLSSRNEATRNTIAQLEAKKKELETMLGQPTQTPECAPESSKASETPTQPEKSETSEQTEAVPEENGIIITFVESEEVVEAQEEQKEKKTRRFF